MAATFQLEIATPDRLLVREQATEAQIPAANGYVGILPQHSPLLTSLGTGLLEFVAGGKKRRIAISGGLLEVLPDQVRVLADRAENADEIDLARATEALKRAEERLSKIPPGTDVAKALHAAERARSRLAAAERK